MGIIIDKLTGNPLLVEVKEADLDTALKAKVNQGKVAGTFAAAMPTGTIATDKVYDFVGTDNTTIGGIVWRNGDSAYYNGSIWTRIPFQSLANYYTKPEILKEWIINDSYTFSSIVYDSKGYISTANITWIDGDVGTISNTTVGAYGITSQRYNRSNGNYATLTVTYNTNGSVATTSITFNF